MKTLALPVIGLVLLTLGGCTDETDGTSSTTGGEGGTGGTGGAGGMGQGGSGGEIFPPADPTEAGLTLGQTHACAIIDERTICWGDNTRLQLGHSSDGYPPAAGAAIESPVALAAGVFHSCSMNSEGLVQCWGDGEGGTAVGSVIANTDEPLDVPVPGPANVMKSKLSTTCAILTNGKVWCWGTSNLGSLEAESVDIVEVVGVSDATQIAVGAGSACVTHDGGTVSCWGDNNYGQLGTGTASIDRVPEPAAVEALTSFTAISFGLSHACGLGADGTVSCWGDNREGQIDDSTDPMVLTPRAIAGLTNIVQIEAGENHTCARDGAGVVSCWGSNRSGQLGDGTLTDSPVPVLVTGLGVADDLALGKATSCAIVEGSPWCWGFNGGNALGIDGVNESATPVRVELPN